MDDMPELIPVLTETEIEQNIQLLAHRISEDYRNKNLVMIGVLKGAFVFLSDLMRRLTIPVEVEFIRLSSYGKSHTSSGRIDIRDDIALDLKDKDVLIVEDIVDTGLTLSTLAEHLKTFMPKSVKICALVDKLERRKTDCKVDYACHTVEGGFLVGYGLDYAEKYRNLPAIYHLKL
jgi:hypoxanthine phosphoribosyltransferase